MRIKPLRRSIRCPRPDHSPKSSPSRIVQLDGMDPSHIPEKYRTRQEYSQLGIPHHMQNGIGISCAVCQFSSPPDVICRHATRDTQCLMESVTVSPVHHLQEPTHSLDSVLRRPQAGLVPCGDHPHRGNMPPCAATKYHVKASSSSSRALC